MFNPEEFAATTAKPLPLYLLLDTSGSMAGDKIDELNKAVNDLVSSLSSEEKIEVKILISIITFGLGEVSLHTPLTSASEIGQITLIPGGLTPMGQAITKAKEMIEDRNITPSRAYRPTVILMSDGFPTDSYETPLNNFIKDGRSQKCDRMALSIQSGEDGERVLKNFILNSEHELFTVNDAKEIHKFFQYVTMSITARSKSQNPNIVINSKELQKETSMELEQGEAITLENNSKSKSKTTSTKSTKTSDDDFDW